MASRSPDILASTFVAAIFWPRPDTTRSYRRHGPGQLLVNEILSETPQRGLHEFDFVGPATWDESRWASARRTNYRVFIFRKSWYGELLWELRISVRGTLAASCWASKRMKARRWS